MALTRGRPSWQVISTIKGGKLLRTACFQQLGGSNAAYPRAKLLQPWQQCDRFAECGKLCVSVDLVHLLGCMACDFLPHLG